VGPSLVVRGLLGRVHGEHRHAIHCSLCRARVQAEAFVSRPGDCWVLGPFVREGKRVML
jgi:hypothetical protein